MLGYETTGVSGTDLIMAGRPTLVSDFLFEMHGAGCIPRAKTQYGYSYLPSVVIYATLYTANFLEAVTKGQQHPLRRISWLSMCCFLGVGLVEMVVAAAHVKPVLAGNPNKSLITGGCEGVQVRMRALGAG
jgi:hypothetical protein